MIAIELNGLLNTNYSQKHIQDLLIGKPIVRLDLMRVVKLNGQVVNVPQGALCYTKDSDGVYRAHGTIKQSDGNPDIKFELEYDPSSRTYKVEGEYFERAISRIYIE